MTREIRLADDFLLEAIRQFRQERGPNGEPSVEDFITHDLPKIEFVFSEFWDTLNLWQEHSNYRHRYIQGIVAYSYYVVGREQPDGSIELVDLHVDQNWPETES